MSQIRETIDALREAGNPVIAVYDGTEHYPITNAEGIEAEARKHAEAYLLTSNGAWVHLVMGGDNVIADHALDIEPIMRPILAGL